MQLRKAVAAGAMGLLMAGSTLAFAATLADYPSPFVQDGQVNALIVVGADAATSDVVGAINLAAGLASVGKDSSVNVPGSSGTASISGEGTMLDTEGTKLYLGDAVNKVKDVITSSDLPTLLAKGTFTDDDGTNYDYTQFIELGGNQFKFKQDESGEDPAMLIEMSTSDGSPLYTLEVDFTKEVDFNDAASKGQSITLFGKEFTVSSDTDGTKLVLYGAANEVSLNSGEETTVDIGGTTYTIKVLGFTAGNKVTIQVGNDVETLGQGEAKKIGGIKIFAKTVSSWDAGNAGTQGVTVLQLGSQKVILEDGEAVQVGDDEEEIDGTMVDFASGTPDGLSTIKIKVYAPDSDHDSIKVGNEFEDPVFGTFKVKFASVNPALDDSSRDEIRFRTSGDHKAYVRFTDRYGNTKDVYFAYDDSGTIKLQYDSDANHKILLVEGATAEDEQYLFLAPGDAKRTHLVKVKNIHADDDGNSDDYAEFYDVMSGTTYKTKTESLSGTTDTTTLTVDGKQYTVTFSDKNGNDYTKVSVTYAGDGETVLFPAIEAAKGETVAITDVIDPTGTAANDLGAYSSHVAVTPTFRLPTGAFYFEVEDDGSATATLYIAHGDGAFVDSGEAISGTGTAEDVVIGGGHYDIAYTLTDDTSADDATLAIGTVSVHGAAEPGILIKEEKDTANDENTVYVETEDNGSNHKIGFGAPTFSATTTSGAQSTSDDDLTEYVDYYGTFVKRDTSESDQPIVTVYYPDNQMYFTAALLASGATITTSGATEGQTIEYKEAVPVTANIAMLDSEVTDDVKAGNNLILVGGPAVNSLVADLFVNKYGVTPAEDGKIYGAQLQEAGILQPGEALVELFEDAFATGKVALVVAGWSADDTRYACEVLQNYAQHSDVLTGTKAVLTR